MASKEDVIESKLKSQNDLGNFHNEQSIRDSQSCSQLVNLAMPISTRSQQCAEKKERCSEFSTQEKQPIKHMYDSDGGSNVLIHKEENTDSDGSDEYYDDGKMSDDDFNQNYNPVTSFQSLSPSRLAKRKCSYTDDHVGLPHKRRHRRRKGGAHHQQRYASIGNKEYRPYTELSWDEKSALDEKAVSRAVAKREEMAANGQPMAPYNTTQFIMDQANEVKSSQEGNDLGTPPVMSDAISSKFTQEEDKPCEEEEFLQKQFSKDYKVYQVERWQVMEKPELIKTIIALESKLEELQKDTMDSSSEESEPGDIYDRERARSHKNARIKVHTRHLETEVKLLKQANINLLRDNQHMRRQLKANANLSAQFS